MDSVTKRDHIDPLDKHDNNKAFLVILMAFDSDTQTDLTFVATAADAVVICTHMYIVVISVLLLLLPYTEY